MKRFLSLTLLLILVVVPAQAAERLMIAGTGDSQTLLRQIAAAYEQANPNVEIAVPDSVGSSGGIRAVIEGFAEFGRVARPLKEDEAAHNLEYRVFAYSPVVFVVSGPVAGIEGLSTEQLLGIFSGKIINWQQVGGPDLPILVVNREAGDSSRTVLTHQLPGFEHIEQTVGLVLYTTPEARTALVSQPGSIGFLPLAMAGDPALTVLAIDGQRPDPEAVRSGRYPMVTPFALVWQEPLDRVAQHFLFFLQGAQAEEIIRRASLVPAP